MNHGAMTGDAALAAFLVHVAQERRASPRTVEAYGHAGRTYLAFLQDHRGEPVTVEGLTRVTAGEVRAFLARRRMGDHPLSSRSLSQALSAVRSFHRFLDLRLDAPCARARSERNAGAVKPTVNAATPPLKNSRRVIIGIGTTRIRG